MFTSVGKIKPVFKSINAVFFRNLRLFVKTAPPFLGKIIDGNGINLPMYFSVKNVLASFITFSLPAKFISDTL